MTLDVLTSLVLPPGREPGSPCLTYLHLASGERTELSGRAAALWVCKTANFVVDELCLEPGDVLALRLPSHWQAWTWLLGAWLAGCVVDVEPGPGVPPDAGAVVVPASALAGTAASTGFATSTQVVSLALRPMALPGPPPPPGVIDFDTDVRGHGDRFGSRPGSPGRLRAGAYEAAWTTLLDPSGPQVPAEVPAEGPAAIEGPGRRLLTSLAPSGPDPVSAVAAVVRALAAGSGVVLLGDRPQEGRAAPLDGEGVTHATTESRHLLA